MEVSVEDNCNVNIDLYHILKYLQEIFLWEFIY